MSVYDWIDPWDEIRRERNIAYAARTEIRMMAERHAYETRGLRQYIESLIHHFSLVVPPVPVVIKRFT